ncbi:MAG: glycoside hydrolase family 13, partial [Chloroflexi bacterium]|nr:glycoside hydrolase family 13 [Chloroflexota bacterium]
YWEIQLELPVGQSFAYRYLVNNDTWCNDCNADAYIPDPYGTFNSVVQT